MDTKSKACRRDFGCFIGACLCTAVVCGVLVHKDSRGGERCRICIAVLSGKIKRERKATDGRRDFTAAFGKLYKVSCVWDGKSCGVWTVAAKGDGSAF